MDSAFTNKYLNIEVNLGVYPLQFILCDHLHCIFFKRVGAYNVEFKEFGFVWKAVGCWKDECETTVAVRFKTSEVKTGLDQSNDHC